MMAHTHILFGLGAWLGLSQALGAPAGAAELGAAALGSLLPDIDHPKSAVGRRLPFISHPVAALVGHRGVTHSLLMILAGCALLWFAGREWWWSVALASGYLSHLLGDWLTLSGIPLLWPWRRRFRSPFPIRTNSPAEWGITAALGAWLWWARPEWLHGWRLPGGIG